jgi:hypothetical protein
MSSNQRARRQNPWRMGGVATWQPLLPGAFGQGGVQAVLSHMSIVGATSEHRVSAIPWLTDAKTLDKANVRQNLPGARQMAS